MTKKQDGGSNLTGIAQYNERLILQHIRRAGSLPKAEIARMTGLSAQTASVIINRLIDKKLLKKQKKRISTGKAGQPAVPVALNPQGAFSIGVKIGRRGLGLMLINFTGEILERIDHSYDYPDPALIFPRIEEGIANLKQSLGPNKCKRLLGIGVAAPYAIGGWPQEVEIPEEITANWNEINIKQRIQDSQLEPVWMVNDATAACIASLEFDNPEKFSHYLYLFIGTFIGGGVVMNRILYNGTFNNAGAIGSMPLPVDYAHDPALHADDKTAPNQLIHCASRYLLDKQLKALDVNPDEVLQEYCQNKAADLPQQQRDIVNDWLKKTARAIAYAITSAVSIIDFEGIMIDGLLPPVLTQELTRLTREEMDKLNLQGLTPPQLYAGSIGNKARALGGAFLPFYTSFAPDRSILISSEKDVFNNF